MEFCKPGFLAFFVPFLIVYWTLRSHGSRMGWLLLGSAIYYALFNPWFILLMLASTSIDYIVALRLPSVTSPANRRWLVALCIATNLGILAYFKYLLFAVTTASMVSGWLGSPFDAPVWKVVLPLGISFYTFEAISYVVDVYRGSIRPLRSPRDYLLYLSLIHI